MEKLRLVLCMRRILAHIISYKRFVDHVHRSLFLVQVVMNHLLFILFFMIVAAEVVTAGCISTGDQNTINNAFYAAGASAVVQLCPNAILSITGLIQFTANN